MMKKLILSSFIGIMMSLYFSHAGAEEKAPLGIGNVAIKASNFRFDDEVFEEADAKNGFFVGAEMYLRLAAGLYIGYEFGWANQKGDLPDNAEIDVTYIPLELNAKYVFAFGPHFRWDVGTGFSFNYATREIKSSGTPPPEKQSDWLFGSQLFTNVTWLFKKFFVGVDFKYQFTDKFKDTDTSYHNWRAGGHIGWAF
jgi:hypothetical protein